jgi:hypothetical protein
VQRLAASRRRLAGKPADPPVAGAETDGLTVLRYDAGFDLIASVTRRSCEQVLAPGPTEAKM